MPHQRVMLTAVEVECGSFHPCVVGVPRVVNVATVRDLAIAEELVHERVKHDLCLPVIRKVARFLRAQDEAQAPSLRAQTFLRTG